MGSLLLTLESDWLRRGVVGDITKDDLGTGASNGGIE